MHVLQRGQRVHLRKPVPDDQDAYLRLASESADFLRPWEPGPPPGAPPEERFTRLLALNEEGRAEKMLVCLNDGDGIAGAFNISNIVLGAFRSATLGYWIGARYARQGYMAEALQLGLMRAFSGLGLHRVEANIMPHNEASIRLVKRAGFRKEGYSPRYLKIAGRWSDHERWALLSDEWEKPTASSRT